MSFTRLSENLYILPGGVNTGVVISGQKALLIDCCDSVTPDRLRELGVEEVDRILCTQFRRPNMAGAYSFVENGTRLTVPAAERPRFDRVDDYWNSPGHRWHLYNHRPGPQVPVLNIEVSDGVEGGDIIEWEDARIRVLETPAATDRSVSYVVEVGDERVCFSGDVICGPGRVYDIHSLQKPYDGMTGYHSFLGARTDLLASLEELEACGAEHWIPSHGNVIDDPAAAAVLLRERLDALWRNYASSSAMSHYFPGVFADIADDPGRMKPGEMVDLPDFVQLVPSTSCLLISETGAAFLIDCLNAGVVRDLERRLEGGEIQSVDACWITHYHDDHVDGLQELRDALACPLVADSHVAAVIEDPKRFFLPCISPGAAPVERVTRDGETWTWQEFTMTAFHMPGQTYYHGGLLVEGRGVKIFFVGDSFSPTGFDDYCAQNRNFLGAGTGHRRCLELVRERRPDLLFNQHQDKAFRFTEEQLDHMEKVLVDRERLLADLLPWSNPNFGTDENWVIAYPFEQEVEAGQEFWIDVRFTNHGPDPVVAAIEPVLPPGWSWNGDTATLEALIPPGLNDDPQGPGTSVRARLTAAGDAQPGRYGVPFRVTWDGTYLGQYRHGIVVVRPGQKGRLSG